MMPKWHILFGFIFSLIIVSFFNLSWIQGAIVFISSILIDLDHYVLYIFKERNFHPLRFWNWSLYRTKKWKGFSKKEKKLHRESHFLLHGVETILVLFILSFIWEFFFWVFLGFSFHIFLDICERIFSREHIAVKFSQIWIWQRNKQVVSLAIVEKDKNSKGIKSEKKY